MAKDKLPADVYAPMESKGDGETISGKKLEDVERSRARAKAMKDYVDASKQSGVMADIANTARSAIHHLPDTEPYGPGSNTLRRRKEEAEGRMKMYKKGGKVSSASSRGDGCAKRGKTKGKMI
jgi:hypothetical protein